MINYRSCFPALFLFLISLPVCLFAQTTDTIVKRYSLENGLSQSTVFGIEQDNYGRMWFATADGLNCFDGYSFKVIKNTIPGYRALGSNSIFAIKKDFKGNLWLGTEKGIYLYASEKNELKEIKITGVPAGFVCWSFFIDSNNMFWCAMANGLFRFSLTEFYLKGASLKPDIDTTFRAVSLVHFQQFSNGDVYVLSGMHSLYSSQFRKKNLPEQLKVVQPDIPTQWIYEVSKNIFLLGKKNAVYKVDTEKGNVSKCTFPAGFEKLNKPMNVVTKGINDELIIAFYSVGVFRYSLSNNSFTRINSHKSGDVQFCTSIYFDKNNTLWMGSGGGEGVLQLLFAKQKFTKISTEAIAGYPIKDMLKNVYALSDTTFLFGFFNFGLYRYNIISGKSEKLPLYAGVKPAEGGILCSARESDTSVILGGPDGVFRMNIQTGRISFLYSISIFDRTVEAVCVLPNGNILAGTRAGITELTPAGSPLKTNFSHSFSSLLAEGVSTVNIIGNTLYIGTNVKGLITFDLKTSVADTTLAKRILGLYPGINNHIKSIVKDNLNRLWIGTQNGIAVVSAEGEPVKYISEQTGLANCFIYGLLADRNNRIWVSTNKGLSVISPEFTVRNFRPADGLQALEYNTGAYAITPNGTMLFGGIAGVNIFRPETITDEKPVFDILLTDYKINSASALNSQPAITGKEISLAYDKNNLFFETSALVYNIPDGVEYSFYMAGLETEWQYTGKNNFIRYTSLPPGEYTLYCRASEPGGIWSKEVSLLHITVTPPFWKTIWFLLICFIVLTAVTYIIVKRTAEQKYKQRMQKLKQEQLLILERERIARDMHDDIGASLTKLAMQSRLLLLKNSTPELVAIEQDITGAVQKLDEIVWTVNPKNDTLRNLTTYITEYTEQFFSSSEMNYRFDIPAGLPDIPLHSEARQHILMIVKEALSNCSKYSDADTVTLALRILHNESWSLTISDNGKGFDDKEINTNSNGLKNMAERASLIPASYQCISSPGNGTTICLTIPYTDSHKYAIEPTKNIE